METPSPSLSELARQLKNQTGTSIAVFGRGALVRNSELAQKAQEIINHGGTSDEVADMLKDQITPQDLKPTRLVEKTVYKKNPGQGFFGPETHPMIDELVDPDDPHARFAGAHLNALAAARLTWQTIQAGQPPISLQFAAGCTQPLSDYTDHPEGFALLHSCVRQLGVWELRRRRQAGETIPSDPHLPLETGLQLLQENQVSLVLQPQNRNSLHDGATSYLQAAENGCRKLIVLTVGLHTPRSNAMMEEIAAQAQHHGIKLKIEIISSEAVLTKYEAQRGTQHYKTLLGRVEGTHAHLVTAARELRGLQAAVAKRYQSAQGTSLGDFNLEQFYQTQYRPQVVRSIQ